MKLTYMMFSSKYCRVCVYADKIEAHNEKSDQFYKRPELGLYSETGFHIDMERNFVCLWRRLNCRSQVIDLSLSALIS